MMWYCNTYVSKHVLGISKTDHILIYIFSEMEKRTNQVVVMTGGARGIGFDIVKKLLHLDYTVILGKYLLTHHYWISPQLN